MALDQRAPGGHGRMVHIVHQLHRMRVAHGNGGDPDRGFVAQLQGPLLRRTQRAGNQACTIEGHQGGLQHGLAHVHGDAAIGMQLGGDEAGQRLHADDGLVRQSLVVHIAGKAARAVAALLDLAAVGVVDHVFEVDAFGGRGPHREDLVGAHAELAVGQKAVLGCAQAQRAGGFVKDHEIVASALHLGKADLHPAIIPCTAASWRNPGHALAQSAIQPPASPAQQHDAGPSA
ncbi:MAG: hypothetical protein GAK34_02753 [Delftia tsuruhatensis]|nr:MAG: hypothetical protein GAK34_02753 [Delftia tsuruhatensis]